MRLPRLHLPALGLVAVSAVSSCGVGPGPDLSGPEGPSFLAAYSGDWVLLRLESDDLDAKLREAMMGRPGRSPGGMPGGGGGGMPPGGGMTGGRGGGMPGTGPTGQGMVDPEEMRRVMESTRFLARTQTEFGLTLRPDAASFRPADGPAVVIPLGGDESSVQEGEIEYFAAAEWTEEGLVVERKVDGGGRVKDKIHVDDEGRLVVERVIDALRGGKVEGTLVYRRGEG